MAKKKTSDLSRPSKADDDNVRTCGGQRGAAAFTRDDLQRDTYVPSPQISGSPRQHESANRVIA
jgi:hypothetical protein